MLSEGLDLKVSLAVAKVRIRPVGDVEDPLLVDGVLVLVEILAAGPQLGSLVLQLAAEKLWGLDDLAQIAGHRTRADGVKRFLGLLGFECGAVGSVGPGENATGNHDKRQCHRKKSPQTI